MTTLAVMENHLRVATFLANLLDNRFSFLGRRFGLNGVLGLIPGIGDVIPTIISFHIVWIGLQMRLPMIKIIEMVGNVIVNFVIGLLPIIGDYADFFNKANMRNLQILKDYAKNNHVIDGEILQERLP